MMLIGNFRNLNAYLFKQGNKFLVRIERVDDISKYMIMDRDTNILNYTDIFSIGEIHGCKGWVGYREKEIKNAIKAYREGRREVDLISYILP